MNNCCTCALCNFFLFSLPTVLSPLQPWFPSSLPLSLVFCCFRDMYSREPNTHTPYIHSPLFLRFVFHLCTAGVRRVVLRCQGRAQRRDVSVPQHARRLTLTLSTKQLFPIRFVVIRMRKNFGGEAAEKPPRCRNDTRRRFRQFRWSFGHVANGRRG